MNNPTALADQLKAASADANARVRRAGHLPHLRYLHDPDTPGWLADLFTRHALAFRDGRGRICPHIGPAPRVVCAFAWTPGLLTCTGCRHLATPDAAEDSTCDRCRKPCEPIWPGIAQVGPILFAYGLCGTCQSNAS